MPPPPPLAPPLLRAALPCRCAPAPNLLLPPLSLSPSFPPPFFPCLHASHAVRTPVRTPVRTNGTPLQADAPL